MQGIENILSPESKVTQLAHMYEHTKFGLTVLRIQPGYWLYGMNFENPASVSACTCQPFTSKGRHFALGLLNP